MSIPDPTAVAVTPFAAWYIDLAAALAGGEGRTAHELAAELDMAEEEVTCAALALVRAGYLAYDGAYRLTDAPEGE